MTDTPTLTTGQQRIRTSVAAILTEHPHAIVAVMAGISDAISTFDPRRRDDDQDEAA